MDKKEILNYIKQNGYAEIADIQQRFGLSYKDVKDLIDELVANKTLAFESGIRYTCVKDGGLERVRKEAVQSILGDGEDGADRRRAFLEARKRQLIERMTAEMDNNDDDDGIDDIDDEDDEDEAEGTDDDELHFKALKLCIDKNTASASLFQRTFPIGYLKACELIDWMENKGYVSRGRSSQARKVIITKEEFEELYGKPRLAEHVDFTADGDGEDDSFAEYEEFLKNTPDEDDESEVYDNIINRIFQSDEESGIPAHPSWDEDEFVKAVTDRLERLIKSDRRMGLKGAIKKAENYLEAVRDTNDKKAVEVYERLVYEIKNTSGYLYGQLKKQLFDE